MLDAFLKLLEYLGKLMAYLGIPLVALFVVFLILCRVWAIIIILKYNKLPPQHTPSQEQKINIFKQIFCEVPRRYVLDQFDKEVDYFEPRGIHMFCGEQGCGKTISCVEMMLRIQKQYPRAKMITNFAVETEDDELAEWTQLLEYNNGHQGVIVGIDEIQNWFMSGKNQLPEGMLEIVTQNRKHNRILCCTAQVFTRVNKAIREQVSLVYEPHTFLGCFTVVIKYKPIFDSEGVVLKRKYRGMYSFVHTDELRASYDTYKAIHILAKDGFKAIANNPVNNVYVALPKNK